MGILLISEDLDEIMALADRIVVMYEGRIAGELDAAAATVEQLGLLMAGGEQARGLGDLGPHRAAAAPAALADVRRPARLARGGRRW